MINWDLIKKTIVNWFEAESGMTTIWKYSNDTQPDRPYLVINMDSAKSVQGSSPDQAGPDHNGVRYYFYTINFIISVDMYSSLNSGPVLDNLLRKLWQESTRQLFNEKGFTAIDWNDVKDLSFLEQSQWVSRAHSSINFRTSDTVSYGNNTDLTTINIEHVNLEQTVEPGNYYEEYSVPNN